MMQSLILAATLALLPLAAEGVGPSPGMDVQVSANRYSEYQLTKKQTKILDEATKLSAGLRVFWQLYGRWPTTREELESRIGGIDYQSFKGNVSVSYSSAQATIELFDGQDTRHLDIHTEPGNYSDSVKAQALDPSFVIRVAIR